jgi:CubicO group peptidase (beta-lactamase class C family)
MRIAPGILATFLTTVLAIPALAQETAAEPAETVEITLVEPASPVDPGPSPDDIALEGYVDGVIAAFMREHGMPGISVSIVRDGRAVFTKGYGQADVDKNIPASSDTIFRIGSVSKTYVWTLIMILHDRGLIDLDADVNNYIKGFQIPEAFGQPITMNDLMAHRAGFEDSLSGFKQDKDYVEPPGRPDLTTYLANTIPERIFPPGARTSYSNWGATLSAKIVEDIAGMPYEEFLTQEILQPLSLNMTTMRGPDIMEPDLREQLSVGYHVVAGKPVVGGYMSPKSSTPAGSMSASGNDMARWMLFHLGKGSLDGVSLMKPETHDLMWTRHFTDRPFASDAAHGFYTREIAGVEIFGHGGATATFYTDMTLAPSLGLGVFVSQNTTGNPRLILDFGALVVEHLAGKPARPAGDPDFAGNIADYAGTYMTNRRVFSLFAKLFSAPNLIKVSAGAGNTLSVSAGNITQTVWPVSGAPDTFETANGERSMFGRDATGAVTHFSDYTGFHSYDKVGRIEQGRTLFFAIGLAVFFALTTLIGAWLRRKKAKGAQRATAPKANTLVAWWPPLSAIGVLAFGIAFLMMTQQALAGFWVFFANYPPLSVKTVHWLGLVVCALAALGLLLLIPAWRTAAWGWFRKLHVSLFVLSLVFLVVMLKTWNVVFAPLL